jgi:hypothetical protein
MELVPLRANRGLRNHSKLPSPTFGLVTNDGHVERAPEAVRTDP